ncbi:MAG: hypothetical protein PHZ19_11655 [Candidatus Thermoplasmatota archaeon]|nr:hypothetical protein [Candidatus Thermoplasmatota archaeon]
MGGKFRGFILFFFRTRCRLTPRMRATLAWGTPSISSRYTRSRVE